MSPRSTNYDAASGTDRFAEDGMAGIKTHDTARGALTTLGVTGAALVLSAAAAVPALACGHGDGGGSSHAHQHGDAQPGYSNHGDGQDEGSEASQDGEEGSSGQETSGAQAETRPGGHAYGHSKKDKPHGADHADHAGHAKAPKESNTGGAGGGGAESGHNPPGNNGTVKIH